LGRAFGGGVTSADKDAGCKFVFVLFVLFVLDDTVLRDGNPGGSCVCSIFFTLRLMGAGVEAAPEASMVGLSGTAYFSIACSKVKGSGSLASGNFKHII
jgi:hypothetical protein